MYRNVVFVVLLMLARPCFLFHKTVLNECAISIRGKFTMKIWPKYILRKWIHIFIQSARILLPSTAQGSEVWENTDQINTNDNARIYLWTTVPCHMIFQYSGTNIWCALLTKLVQPRRLEIGRVLLYVYADWNEVLVHKYAKKNAFNI